MTDECSWCGGRGFLFDYAEQGAQLVSFPGPECEHCEGTGKVRATDAQIEELRALQERLRARQVGTYAHQRTGERYATGVAPDPDCAAAANHMDALLSLAAQAQRMREALEEIVRGGAPFDAKGTHTRAVVALARAALEQSDSRNVRDDEVRAKGPADRAPEAGEKPAQDE